MSNEEVLENVIKGCPLIETLNIWWCNLDNPRFNFKVLNLPNIKKLDIFSGQDETAVEVHATSLEYVKCSSFYRSSINLGKHEYPNLKTLDLRKAQIVDANFFINFGCKFPMLEYLSVVPVLGTARINLWSPSLKEIRLFVKRQSLDEACFDVPNIVTFVYTQKCICRVLPKLYFTGGKCIAQIELTDCTDDVQGSWFLKQKEFFAQLNVPFEASIHVCFPEGVFFNEAHWITARSISFPPAEIPVRIQNVFIALAFGTQEFSLSSARGILDAIFSTYRPPTLTFYYSSIYSHFADCLRYEHNVKYLWNATNSTTHDKILELLKPREKDRTFVAVFNLT